MDGRIDYSVNLVYNTISRKLPIFGAEEKFDLIKLDSKETRIQITKYKEALFNQKSDDNRIAANYESLYFLLIEQNTKHVRLLTFSQLRRQLENLARLSITAD